MKSPLPYFLEFFEDEFMLPKIYLNDCEIKGTNQKPIIMITYDETKFSVKDGCWKRWTLDEHGILQPKEEKKDIMGSDFFSP